MTRRDESPEEFLQRANIEQVNIVEFPSPPAAKVEPLPLGTLSPPKPYPVSALGRVLGPATESISQKAQCAPVLAAQATLAVASLAAQHLADVCLPYGQTRPLSLFLFTVAGSGERKSTADNEALMPVRKHEKNVRLTFEILREAWRVSHAAWAAQHKKIEGDRGLDRISREAELTALGRAPVEPVHPFFTAPEPTVESLAKHWATLPGSLGLFSAEGGQLTGGFGFAPEHRLKTAAGLSSLWDGAGLRRFRAGDTIADLPGRRLALHVMLQPDAAEAFVSDPILRDQGLLSRLLLAAPDSLAGERKYKDPPEHLDTPMTRYFAAIMAMLERPPLAANEAGNELTPRALDLSPQAKVAWIAFHDRIEAGMATDGLLENLRDVGGKAAENAARIAGVLTIVDNPDATIVEAEQMEAGCEVMAWYVNEALRLLDAWRLPPSLRNARRLRDWLKAKGKREASLSEIMQYGPYAIRRKKEAEAALTALVEHGYVVRRGAGRSPRWEIVAETRSVNEAKSHTEDVHAASDKPASRAQPNAGSLQTRQEEARARMRADEIERRNSASKANEEKKP